MRIRRSKYSLLLLLLYWYTERKHGAVCTSFDCNGQKKKKRKKNLSVWETTVLGCFTPSQPVRLYQSDWKTTKQNKKRVGIFRRRKQIGSLLEPDHPRDAEMLENRNIGARKRKKISVIAKETPGVRAIYRCCKWRKTI